MSLPSTLHERIAVATQDVTVALSELQVALDALSSGTRADKRMINEALVAAFERLAVTERSLKTLRDELEAEARL
ncbi:MAG: hypothetical protein DI536_30590 [Archangium gephyra]|uniref:Uncharacterized protein n=1 Tax=Archangium gephyra TaxID=48 RepID=A0A2W5T4B7_9BACT|nr:MAG: hypothetical protein DI536_30590 [Archangium gephyra]